METTIAQGAGQSTVIHTSFFEAVLGWIRLPFVCLIGALVILVILAVILKRNRDLPRVRTAAASLLFYYYLCVASVYTDAIDF